MMLFEQHPYFFHRRFRDSRYQRPRSRRVRSVSRLRTRPSFSGLGAARLFQCISRFNRCLVSVLILALSVTSILRCLYSILVCPLTSNVCSLVLDIVLCFFFSVCTDHYLPDWYVSIRTDIKLAYFVKKKTKTEPIVGRRRGHGRRRNCRVGRGEQDEARPAESPWRGGTHLDLGHLTSQNPV